MRRSVWWLLGALVLASLAVASPQPRVYARVATAAHRTPPTYTNPLRPTTSGGTVDNCPDPTVFRGKGGYAARWYAFCTSDPVNDHDATNGPGGGATFRRLPMLTSTDLVHWRHVGQAVGALPGWAAPRAKLWAPAVTWSSRFHRYYLAFAVTDTRTEVSGEPDCADDPAIGYAVSVSPTGPWHVRDTPLVAPRRLGPGCDFAATIDPDLLRETMADQTVLYFGSFRGGLWAQQVRFTATTARVAGNPTQVTVARRYEAADVVSRDGWYYLVASSRDCCNGALSGYGAFVGRSRSAYGPFVDRRGAGLTASRTGGTPFLVATGNRWVGPGHTSVFVDRGGQWWVMYHAIDDADPFFAGHPGFTRRPLLLDPVDWQGGWPTVRAGRGPSTTRVPGPAAQTGQHAAYRPAPAVVVQPGAALSEQTDTFDGSTLSPRWSWVRQPPDADVSVTGGALRLATQATQLVGDTNTASVLLEQAPAGDYVVQTRLALDVPASGSGYGSTQGGLVVYRDDDDYLKLATGAAGETRQTSLAREVPAGATGYPRYGSSSGGPPGDVTWLRLAKRTRAGVTTYRGWTSLDGVAWDSAGAWRADSLATGERIGLVTMGGAGQHATVDSFDVSRVR